jgi:hypothetical protein
MQTTTTIRNMYVEGWENWLCPANVSFKAIPKALMAMMDTLPTVLHIEMYISGFFLPYRGAIL